jgi:hypothetical protein
MNKPIGRTPMKILKFTIFAVAALFATSLSSAQFYDLKDPTMGEYEGFWTAANGVKGRVTAQIRPLSNNRYDGFVLFFRARSLVAGFTLHAATANNDRLDFTAATAAKEQGGELLAENEGTCFIANGKLTGKFKGDLGEGTFEADRSQRKSPTLGATPPAGAIVLFDGKPGDAWENFSWPVQNGVMQVGQRNIKAREKLRDYRLHVEFRVPYMPLATGQERGNSGVYLQGKYEVQVLDSFGVYPLQDNDCGGIYRTRSPRLNACLPPMEWQTYDITFSSDGPRVTVIHNGVTVINEARIPAGLIASGTGGGDPSAGFLLLQDHGNPVQFRNIWAEPLEK